MPINNNIPNGHNQLWKIKLLIDALTWHWEDGIAYIPVKPVGNLIDVLIDQWLDEEGNPIANHQG